MDNVNTIWDYLMQQLKEVFAQNIFDSYIKPARPISFFNNQLVLAMDENIQPQWDLYIKNSAVSILSNQYPDISILIQVGIPQPPTQVPTQALDTGDSLTLNSTSLDPKYTFDNFIVGEGNKMAHAAALAVAESPGKIYNPLFIYGGSGLGKTHLMHAIGNALIENALIQGKPKPVVKYVTSEDFVNQFTTAIRHGAMDQFKDNYRKADLLLVDDIQFLAGKEQTLDEFFHTFNALHSAGKQIVLTSDRLATEIPELPSRLVTRFSSGLSSDITPPDLETRTAILRKKAIAENISVSDDTLNYIAGHFASNIRELEGGLTRVNFYAKTVNREITTSLAAEALQAITSNTDNKVITIYDIQNEVSRFFSVSIDQLKGKQRNKEIVIPRQVAMYLSRELTDQSLPKIGQEFGNRDHTTVMHAYDKINKVIKAQSDLDLIKQIQVIKGNMQ